jgi:hypothetical protein
MYPNEPSLEAVKGAYAFLERKVIVWLDHNLCIATAHTFLHFYLGILTFLPLARMDFNDDTHRSKYARLCENVLMDMVMRMFLFLLIPYRIQVSRVQVLYQGCSLYLHGN